MKYTIKPMKYPTNKAQEPQIKKYSIELQNLETGGIAMTHVETETLNIKELKASLPEKYKYITHWND